MNRPWTGAEQIRLREMLASGMTLEEISVVLDRTVNAVKSRKLDLCIKRAKKVREPKVDKRKTRTVLVGICASMTKRRDRIVEVLSQATEPVQIEEIAARVYDDRIDPSTAIGSARVILFNMRRQGVPIILLPRRGGYLLRSEAA